MDVAWGRMHSAFLWDHAYMDDNMGSGHQMALCDGKATKPPWEDLLHREIPNHCPHCLARLSIARRVMRGLDP